MVQSLQRLWQILLSLTAEQATLPSRLLVDSMHKPELLAKCHQSSRGTQIYQYLSGVIGVLLLVEYVVLSHISLADTVFQILVKILYGPKALLKGPPYPQNGKRNATNWQVTEVNVPAIAFALVSVRFSIKLSDAVLKSLLKARWLISPDEEFRATGAESHINWLAQYHFYRQELQKPLLANWTRNLLNYWQYQVFGSAPKRVVASQVILPSVDATLNEFTQAVAAMEAAQPAPSITPGALLLTQEPPLIQETGQHATPAIDDFQIDSSFSPIAAFSDNGLLDNNLPTDPPRHDSISPAEHPQQVQHAVPPAQPEEINETLPIARRPRRAKRTVVDAYTNAGGDEDDSDDILGQGSGRAQGWTCRVTASRTKRGVSGRATAQVGVGTSGTGHKVAPKKSGRKPKDVIL